MGHAAYTANSAGFARYRREFLTTGVATAMGLSQKSAMGRVFSAEDRVLGTVSTAASFRAPSTLRGLAGLRTAEQAEAAAQENAAIAQGLKRQDTALLDQLIDQYQHRLMRYLTFLTGRRETAEDLFQETWIRVLLRGAQFNGKARFDTWLFTIARNLVIDLSRKKTMASLDEMQDPGEDERPFEIAGNDPSPYEQFRVRENAAEVAAMLLKLHPTYREVLVLRFHEELPLEEIASVTRSPLSTVKSRLYRGLAALKPEIERVRAARQAEAGGETC